MSELLPIFVDLQGRRVLLVGGGTVAAAKLMQLLAAGADVHVVAPEVCGDIERALPEAEVAIERRGFAPADLDHVWLVVAAATPDVNRLVAQAAERRRVFVNAVDDPASASAYLSGVVRRDGVTLAISTSGAAPGLTALLRQALDRILPLDLAAWVEQARVQRVAWRRHGVPMERRRPLLLRALNELYQTTAERSDVPKRTTEIAETDQRPDNPASSVPGVVDVSKRSTEATETDRQPSEDSVTSLRVAVGRVSLVGAGPGDPGLLTRRAVARLRGADVVLYDALIDRRVLKLARHAQKFFVGKRAGGRAMSQQTINGLMTRMARRGKRVVRLKGGDPFVFGRGGEETLALQAAGVRVEVVPGVTSAVAAPALAGIPVTHRGVSSAFLVVGGHELEAFESAIAAVAPNDLTLVVLMGVGRRAALARRLLDRGWLGGTPAAIVIDASRPTQTVWRGTLTDLASERVDIEQDGPGTIVIGQVVTVTSEAGESGQLVISSSGH
jgi:uroporphyrin-III C-methyltransferase/precorrin-2 dehydrogenase/sirohydrochlorin ferrochelatase